MCRTDAAYIYDAANAILWKKIKMWSKEERFTVHACVHVHGTDTWLTRQTLTLDFVLAGGDSDGCDDAHHVGRKHHLLLI